LCAAFQSDDDGQVAVMVAELILRVSPIFGVTIPKGCRQWELIAPSQQTDPLNELRTMLGNPLAFQIALMNWRCAQEECVTQAC
jgi:hypothetical protein